MIFTTEELEMRKFRRTAFYQEVVYKKLEDIIIDKQYRITRACESLGEDWKRVNQYLSTEQKAALDVLTKKYSRNGGRRLRKIATRTHIA
jgi:hypothetical protein